MTIFTPPMPCSSTLRLRLLPASCGSGAKHRPEPEDSLIRWFEEHGEKQVRLSFSPWHCEPSAFEQSGTV